MSIIIPTMNEEKSIGETLDRIPRDFAELDIMIVDTNSKDKTREIAVSKGARVVEEPRRGYGRAYKTGFAAAQGDIIVTLDGDTTYPPEDIPKLVKMLEEENLDFITTDRLSMMEEGAMNKTHKLGNWVLVVTMNILFRMKLKDSQSGMWVFRKNILEKMQVYSDKMAFSEEIKVEAWRRGFKCKEVPIRYESRKGEVKLNTWKDGMGNEIFLIKKRLGMIKPPE
ncbi:MAG: glycosyltransferase family 2 protein [Candidatus Thermoplasmatota archaeon]|nr:glycosyltransferase family 2 protein [Candidatus Thermoplasmatota archaeon]